MTVSYKKYPDTIIISASKKISSLRIKGNVWVLFLHAIAVISDIKPFIIKVAGMYITAPESRSARQEPIIEAMTETGPRHTEVKKIIPSPRFI
jgi:hypothetical protein